MDRTRTFIRSTTLPIWGMVGVALATSATALFIHTASLRTVDTIAQRITSTGSAAEGVDNAFGLYAMAIESESMRLLERSPTTATNALAFSLPSPPSLPLAQLVTEVDAALHPALRAELEQTAAVVRESRAPLTDASEWRRLWGAAETARSLATREIREQVARLRDLANDRRAPEPAGASIPLAEVAAELLELDLQARAVAEATDEPALEGIVRDHVEPTLARLDALVLSCSLGTSGSDAAVRLRTSLLGQAGASGLAFASLERIRLDRQRSSIEEANATILGRLVQAQTRIDALIGEELTRLRSNLDASIHTAAWRTLVATAVGLMVLAAIARTLARQMSARTSELVGTVEELRKSRVELVHLSELRDALAKLEHANHEMSVQRAALDQAGAVCEADEKGVITYVNDHCCSLSGYDRTEILGTEQRQLLAAEHPPEHWDHVLRALTNKGRWKGVLCSRAKTGAPFWAQTTILSLTNADGMKRFVAIGTDISSQVAAEQTLEEQAASLAEARARAEEASIAKSAFLAAMSHEIRTPLNGVFGALDLLGEGSLSDQQRRYIQISQTSAATLMSIIDDILDFSKIEAGRLELSPSRFELRQLIEDVGGMLSMKAVSRGLELVVSVATDLPECVWGDAERLRQILINLVNNAIKFTERGTVTVRVESAPTEDVSRVGIRVEVNDTGIGIPEDRIHLLFRSFSQTDASMSRRYGGSGLGLAICKRLAEMMGGSIGVRSQIGVGSTFWFTLPLERSLEQPVLHSATAPTSPRGLAILVVDDNTMVRETLGRYCESWDMRPTLADSVPAAVEVCESRVLAGDPFVAVLCDQTMSELDGFDLAAIFRGRVSLRTIPLILMTPALDMNPELVRAAGFLTHVSKPVRQSEVFDAVLRAITPEGEERAQAAEKARTSLPANPFPPPPSGRRWRVLLAEDNEINLLIAREMLTGAGFDLDVASDGNQAVAMATATEYDLILMDCQMPGMDGFEATRAIRVAEAEQSIVAPREVLPDAAQISRHVPIVALTANALSGDRERCIEAGMDAYCTKPIVLSELLETARLMLSRSPTTLSKAA